MNNRDDTLLRYRRADQLLGELNTIVQQFKSTKPYRFATKSDPQTQELVYHMVRVDPVPDAVSVIAGDIVHNLRTCLEYLAWNLVIANGATPTKDTGFPVFDDAAKYAARRAGKVKGMRQEVIDLIDKIKPYKGGDDLLWRLHKLDIEDKHHLLFTVWAGGAANPGFGALPNSTVKLTPIKAGKEFFRDAPGSRVKKNIDFPTHITISQPGIVDGDVLIAVLRTITNRVRHVIEMFAAWRS